MRRDVVCRAGVFAPCPEQRPKSFWKDTQTVETCCSVQAETAARWPSPPGRTSTGNLNICTPPPPPQLESAPANSCFPCCLQVGVQTLPRHTAGPGRLRHRRRKPCKCVSGTGSPVRWCDVSLIVSSRFPAPTCMKSSMLWWRRRQGRSSRSSWRNLTRRTSVLTLSTLL